ncbi:hypothetical protein [Blastococcus aurantiacus]|uniref:hypothetical protein n=1 Tax=Blastococcus aurantiacus TaxID=1550231 RepID=UPI0011600344|nr:hypothetical protein [Blastococcus aurantiacus]
MDPMGKVRRRSVIGDALAVALLLVLAIVGRRPDAVGTVSRPEAKGGSGGAGSWAAHPLVHLLIFVVLVLSNAIVLWVFRDDPELDSIFITTSLGAVTIWSTWGLFIGGTPTPPGKGWLVVVMQAAVLATCAALSAFYWVSLGGGERSNRTSVAVFAVCTVVAVILDVVQRRRNGDSVALHRTRGQQAGLAAVPDR